MASKAPQSAAPPQQPSRLKCPSCGVTVKVAGVCDGCSRRAQPTRGIIKPEKPKEPFPKRPARKRARAENRTLPRTTLKARFGKAVKLLEEVSLPVAYVLGLAAWVKNPEQMLLLPFGSTPPLPFQQRRDPRSIHLLRTRGLPSEEIARRVERPVATVKRILRWPAANRVTFPKKAPLCRHPLTPKQREFLREALTPEQREAFREELDRKQYSPWWYKMVNPSAMVLVGRGITGWPYWCPECGRQQRVPASPRTLGRQGRTHLGDDSSDRLLRFLVAVRQLAPHGRDPWRAVATLLMVIRLSPGKARTGKADIANTLRRTESRARRRLLPEVDPGGRFDLAWEARHWDSLTPDVEELLLS